MVARRKWLFDFGDYMRDTAHLGCAEHGAYMLLLAHYFTHGSLPTDDLHLRRIAHATGRQWADMRDTIAEFFVMPDWRHKRVEADLATFAAYRDRKRQAARARWEPGQAQLPMPVDNRGEVMSTSLPGKSLKSNNPHHARASYLRKKEDSSSLSTAAIEQPKSKEKNQYGGEASPVGRPRLADHRPRRADTPNRKRLAARQRVEADLAKTLGADGFAEAIDCLSEHPRIVDRFTDAELRKTGSGVLAAMLALRELAQQPKGQIR